MNEEKFRRTLGGSIVSSLGYRLRIVGPAGLEYEDEQGRWRIDSEASVVGRPGSLMFYEASVPRSAVASRDEIASRIVRAFEHYGWEVEMWPIDPGPR